MRYRDSIFGGLLKVIDRGHFAGSVRRHDADRYGKQFSSWSHLVALVFGQLSGASSLRSLEAAWNVHSNHHYHLGVGPLRRSTLADASQRRPTAVFTEVFARLNGLMGRQLRHEGTALVRLIDSTPIPLPELCRWPDWNGRTHGLKLHVVYDPDADHPRDIQITPASVNDVVEGRKIDLERGATYVFDKGYCDYAWWTRMCQVGCRFVTRPKTNVQFKTIKTLPRPQALADGFMVTQDAIVELASQGKAKLPYRLRRVVVRTDDGRTIVLMSNDIVSPANDVAQLYKRRWQIELLFRWIKQNLKIKAFLGRSENAVRLQVLAAMIAFLLLRLAARAARRDIPAIRFAGLVRECLFVRKPLARIDKPPAAPIPKTDPRQGAFVYG